MPESILSRVTSQVALFQVQAEASDIARPDFRVPRRKQPRVGCFLRFGFQMLEEHTSSDAVCLNATTERLTLSEHLHLVQVEEDGPVVILIPVGIVYFGLDVFHHVWSRWPVN